MNDNPPEIQSVDLRGISEDFLPGTSLGFIFAVDADLPSSALEYRLDEKSQEYFSIDLLSGNLSLAKEIDREEISSFWIRMTVTDGIHETEWKKELQVSGDLYCHLFHLV